MIDRRKNGSTGISAVGKLGSRRGGSDIDLTLYGDALTTAELGVIVEKLDDLLLPYQIGFSIFDQIAHAKLREHIERVGVVFYEKGAVPNLG